MQPAALIAPDVELIACTYLRGRLAAWGRTAYVGRTSPTDNRPVAVVVRRDGGPRRGVMDYPRLGVRVIGTDTEAVDVVAQLVAAALLDWPNRAGGVVAVTQVTSGPSRVPESPQYCLYLTVDAVTRCTAAPTP